MQYMPVYLIETITLWLAFCTLLKDRRAEQASFSSETFTVQRKILYNINMYLLYHHDVWLHPVSYQQDWNGLVDSFHVSASSRSPPVSGKLFLVRSTPWSGHSACAWPAAAAGPGGGTPASTAQFPSHGSEKHYIAGNSLWEMEHNQI